VPLLDETRSSAVWSRVLALMGASNQSASTTAACRFGVDHADKGSAQANIARSHGYPNTPMNEVPATSSGDACVLVIQDTAEATRVLTTDLTARPADDHIRPETSVDRRSRKSTLHAPIRTTPDPALATTDQKVGGSSPSERTERIRRSGGVYAPPAFVFGCVRSAVWGLFANEGVGAIAGWGGRGLP
jgi:hypothetical protein